MRIALKILKWVGITLGGLIGVIIIAAVVLYFIGSSKINKTYDVEVVAVTVPTDDQAIERGRHFVEAVALCQECHGQDLSGEDKLEEDTLFGTYSPRNLTPGRGGIGGTFSDIDYVRAIRHGIGKDGKALVIMPAEFFNKISDSDLGAIIAFLKNLPPVDNEVPETSLGPLGRIFTVLESSLLPTTLIDHDAPRPAEPQPGVTVEYGRYMTIMCSLCHGDALSGGSVPGDEPDAPPAPNLTPGGGLARWSEADFINTLRTGNTPDGRSLDSENMPSLEILHKNDRR